MAFPLALVDHHQTVPIIRFGPFPKGLNKKAIVSGRLIYVDPATFHGGSGFPRRGTRFPLDGSTFLALPARSRQKKKSLIVVILEHLAFQFDQRVQILLDGPFLFPPCAGLRCETESLSGNNPGSPWFRPMSEYAVGSNAPCRSQDSQTGISIVPTAL